MTCSRGGLPILRHNEVRDLTAELLKDVCSNVCIKPKLQALDDEHLQLHNANRDDEARLDIRTTNFWCRGQEAFF